MIFADFQCNDCKEIFQGSKKSIHEDFKNITCPKCRSSATKRLYNKVIVQVAEGKLGNAKSGYKNNIVYKPASMTPKKSFRNPYKETDTM